MNLFDVETLELEDIQEVSFRDVSLFGNSMTGSFWMSMFEIILHMKVQIILENEFEKLDDI